MNHDQSTSSSGGVASDEMMMMRPFFHFDGGYYLFFKAWQPQSRGAIAGACVGLLILAILERWVHVVSSVLESRWKQKTLRTQTSAQYNRVKASSVSAHGSEASSAQKQRFLPLRTIPPFTVRVDVPRGILYTFQRFLGYALMLAVMTFHAGYIISILVGLVLGEIFFRRVPQGAVKSDR